MNLFNRYKKLILLSLIMMLASSQAHALWGLDAALTSIKSGISSLNRSVGSGLSALFEIMQENKEACTTLAAGLALYCGYAYWKKSTVIKKAKPQKQPSSKDVHATPANAPHAHDTYYDDEILIPSWSKDRRAHTAATHFTQAPTNALATAKKKEDDAAAKQAAQLIYITPKKKKKGPAPKPKTIPAVSTNAPAQTKAAQEPVQKNTASEIAWLAKIAHAESMVAQLAAKPALFKDDVAQLHQIGCEAEDVLMRCSSTLFDDLHTNYTAMFKQLGMHKNDVYKRLHYKNNEVGIAQSWEKIVKSHDEALDAKMIVINMGGSDQDPQLDCIRFIMRTHYAKENFDCFLQGTQATRTIQIDNSEIKARLTALRDRIAELIEQTEKNWELTTHTFNQLLQERMQTKK